MEEKESKNETTTTIDAFEISKREDEDATLTAQNNADKDSHGVQAVSLGKSLLGDNTIKKGISVSVRGRNAGAVLNLKNGGSVWKSKDEKGQENQKEVGKKIDEESFPDLLESTEKIKSELSKEKDKKKKGGKEIRKLDDGLLRYGSERGKGEGASSEKKRPFSNNLDIPQNNDSGLKNWSDQVNENEGDDVKENEHVIDDKQEAEVVGYLMPGFKGKHMIGFHCFLKKGSHNPPPLPPNVPFDDTSFFETIEKQKSVLTKSVMHNMSTTQHMSQIAQCNQVMQVMQTNPMINMHSSNFLNNATAVGGDNNPNQMSGVNKMNAFNANDKMMREQSEGGYNRYMQTPQIAGLSRGNLNMFNEKVNNANTNNMNNMVNVSGGNRSSTFQNRNNRGLGQNNVNYNASNTDDLAKNNLHNNVNNYNKTNNSIGSMSAGGSMRRRNFNRRYERRDDRKVKIADIDADTNWRSPLNKKVNEEKPNDTGNDSWNGNVDDSNTNNGNNNNNNNNNVTNQSGNVFNINNSSSVSDRIKRNFRNRNTNTLSNVGSAGSANSFNRGNFNANRNFANRNNVTNANVNSINRNNLNKNNNVNTNFMNNSMNVIRNNVNRGNGNRKNFVNLNNNNNANNHYNNVANNKMMNRNFMKRNVGNMPTFGNNGNGSNDGVIVNNLFNRISGNNLQQVAPATSMSSPVPPNDPRATNMEHGNNINMPNESTVVTDKGGVINTEMGTS